MFHEWKHLDEQEIIPEWGWIPKFVCKITKNNLNRQII